MCVIYDLPANDNNALISHITLKLDIALTKHPNAGIILVGDFNKCPVALLLRHFGLKQIVKQPTKRNVTLDLILTNMSDWCNSTSVISAIGLSDHNSVVCMYVCKTLFTDASLVNKIVGFHKGRQTIKKKNQGRYLQKDRKGKKEEKNK